VEKLFHGKVGPDGSLGISAESCHIRTNHPEEKEQEIDFNYDYIATDNPRVFRRACAGSWECRVNQDAEFHLDAAERKAVDACASRSKNQPDKIKHTGTGKPPWARPSSRPPAPIDASALDDLMFSWAENAERDCALMDQDIEALKALLPPSTRIAGPGTKARNIQKIEVERVGTGQASVEPRPRNRVKIDGEHVHPGFVWRVSPNGRFLHIGEYVGCGLELSSRSEAEQALSCFDMPQPPPAGEIKLSTLCQAGARRAFVVPSSWRFVYSGAGKPACLDQVNFDPLGFQQMEEQSPASMEASKKLFVLVPPPRGVKKPDACRVRFRLTYRQANHEACIDCYPGEGLPPGASCSYTPRTQTWVVRPGKPPADDKLHWVIPLERIEKLDYALVGNFDLKVEVLVGKKAVVTKSFQVSWPLCM
jgi:hypothetical protein